MVQLRCFFVFFALVVNHILKLLFENLSSIIDLNQQLFQG